MRFLIAVFAIVAFATLTTSAGAAGIPHFRASQGSGGMHYRASHGHTGQSQVVFSSACRGPVIVTTWLPNNRLYRSGFGHFSRPAIVSQPIVFQSSRGYRSSLGGFVHGQPVASRRGPVCSYNGSVGSNLAQQRKINWEKRARVHSPGPSVPPKGD